MQVEGRRPAVADFEIVSAALIRGGARADARPTGNLAFSGAPEALADVARCPALAHEGPWKGDRHP
jgi:hypothetical protein